MARPAELIRVTEQHELARYIEKNQLQDHTPVLGVEEGRLVHAMMRTAREARGLRQEDLAEEVLVTTGTISHIEKLRIHPIKPLQRDICIALQLDPEICFPEWLRFLVYPPTDHVEKDQKEFPSGVLFRAGANIRGEVHPEGGMEKKDLEIIVSELLNRRDINERERVILIHSFGLAGREVLADQQIADMFGVTRAWISAQRLDILGLLRDSLAPVYLKDFGPTRSYQPEKPVPVFVQPHRESPIPQTVPYNMLTDIAAFLKQTEEMMKPPPGSTDRLIANSQALTAMYESHQQSHSPVDRLITNSRMLGEMQKVPFTPLFSNPSI